MYIGLDIGGTSIKGIITKKDGTIISSFKFGTADTRAKIIDDIIFHCKKNIESEKISIKKIKAIGMGIAGTLDTENGKIIMSPNIKHLNNCPIVKLVFDALKIPVFIENDANVALLGEAWLGNGKKYSHWLMFTLGTGVGGGAIVDGKILLGRDGRASEFGHTNIRPNGNLCGCGNKGCLEAYASATSLVKLAKSKLKKIKKGSAYKRSLKEEVTSKLIYEEAKKKDKVCIEIFEEVSTNLGIGVASLINAFNPEAIIFAGGLSRALDIMLPYIKEEVKKRSMPGLKEKIKFHKVKYEDKGPALGAIKNAIDKLK